MILYEVRKPGINSKATVGIYDSYAKIEQEFSGCHIRYKQYVDELICNETGEVFYYIHAFELEPICNT